MKGITFICCYNNTKQLNKMLLKSIEKIPSGNTNLFLIDSKEQNFKSAAEAYNRTLRDKWEEIGDIIIFLHQDIAFDNIDFINHIKEEFTNKPLQIIGFAGITDKGIVYSNLKYYNTKEYITRNQLTEDKIEVGSIDECCFATTKQVLKEIGFDEKCCSHWHLYAVDLCYNAKRKNIVSFIISDVIYHKEDGRDGLYTDYHFLKTMWKMVLKYRNDFTTIYAPCYICTTNPFKAFIRLARTAIKNYFKQ